MKPSYSSKSKKFVAIASLVAVAVLLWQFNILINKYKLKAETEASAKEEQTTQKEEHSQNITPYNVADNNYEQSQNNNSSQENYKEPTQSESNDTSSDNSENQPVEEVLPSYTISTNHETCITEFIEFDLLTKAGFTSLDEQTKTSTYKGLCDELIYSKPTNSYEFIYERSDTLPEMPYYVEASGTFLLDNYEVRYQ